MDNMLKVGMAQISPVWLNKSQTLEKIMDYITLAAKAECDLVVFGEGLLPGYPFWLSITDGATFESKMQKEIHAHYVRNSIEIAELDQVCKLAKAHSVSIYLGVIEKATDRGGHSIYCSLVYIDASGIIQSVHRKLQPTYEERLTWAAGDGNGLKVHGLKNFTLGGLNCWENWMPLARTSLYAQGENVHVAVWPGSEANTKEITRFIAKESRSYVISVSSLMKKEDFPKETPHYETIMKNSPNVLANGGSCVAGPNGEWLVAPVLNREELITAELDFDRVLEERQNFDPSGHYSRPDVTKLIVDRKRQSTIEIID